MMLFNNDPNIDPTESISIPDYRKVQTNLFYCYSVKAGKKTEFFESAWEYRFFLLCESNPNIARITPQPYKINERIDGKKLNYTFDFWLRWMDGYREYIEVKPTGKLLENSEGILLPPKWPQIEIWSEKYKPPINLRFVTDDEINKHSHLIKEWDRMTGYLQRWHQNPREEIENRVKHYIKHQESVLIQDVISKVPHNDENDVIASIVNLIHIGYCLVDLKKYCFNRNLRLFRHEK